MQRALSLASAAINFWAFGLLAWCAFPGWFLAGSRVCDGTFPCFHSTSCSCSARCRCQKTIWKSSSSLWNTTWRAPQPKAGACGKCLRTSPHQLNTDGERGSLGEGAGGARAQASPDPHVQFCRAVHPSGVWHLQNLAGIFSVWSLNRSWFNR